MKKSLLALAVLGAFAGAASAQSTVTLYGRVDLSLNKPIGTDAKGVANGSGSRLGVRGVEDLGGGLKALFQIEHRFNADTGAMSDAARMWGGRSIVGIEGGFGRFWMGREYTPSFLTSELLSDPWGYDTVAAQAYMTGSGAVRSDNSVNYQVGFGGFTFWGQISEADAHVNPNCSVTATPVAACTPPGGNLGPDRPVGFSLSYGAGPLYLAWGHQNNAGDNDRWNHFTANYDFGAFKLWSGFGTGKSNADAKVRTWSIAGTAPVGGGEVRAAIGQQKVGGVKTVGFLGLGYHYAMSKRTTLYFDYARNRELSDDENGYDVGIKHNF
jgi:predicted porin